MKESHLTNDMKLIDSEIKIKNLRLFGRHGVLEQEKATGGDFNINIRVTHSVAHAMATDELDDTISYADVFDLVKKEFDVPSRLLENVAARIAQSLFDAFASVWQIRLEIIKLNPPMGADCDGAGVEICVNRE
ncbi:MAG: dihydroneopterin aldolase [Prevotellaceae bacterium]|nr:dihydroneopterin aldolase [Prevotella sp.]MDD7530599.1 dihydroneopterin aldolase [Prevotellaceae bacterium]